MSLDYRPGVAAAALAVLLLVASGCGEGRTETTFVCPPCAAHDTLRFEHDGECPVCGMKLTEKPDSVATDPVHLHEGSGNFTIPGGRGHPEKLITLYYHRPESFTPGSPVLIVVPGAGRNAWDYRDAWVETSERHGVLVLSPRYPEVTYPFGAYHMGGLMKGVNVAEAVEFVDGSHQARLDEEALDFEVGRRPEEWIFGELDRIFERAAAAVGSERERYDVFGHSAGGQILHRAVLFHPQMRADRIVAANAGFYTLPDLDTELPFGMAGTPADRSDLRAALGRELTLLLGEEDDGPEAGGTFLRSPSADAQGAGRLQRGRYFVEAGKAKADSLGVAFGWSVETVPGVGHDYERMSQAAAAHLYGG